MGIRVILVLLVLGGLGIYWGGTNFYTALKERTPLELSCKEYLEQKPDNRYLKLVNCDADMDNTAIYEESDKGGGNKRITAVYIPLRAKGVTGGKTQIVLVRRDSDIIDMMKMLDRLGSTGEPTAEQKALIEKVMAQLDGANEGLVQFGLDLSDSDKTQLKGLGLGLGDDFVLVEAGKEPKLLLGGLALFGGLAVFAFMIRGIVKRFRPAT